MRLPRIFGLERVEDPVCRVADLEPVLRNGSFLARGELTTAAQEVAQIVSLPGLRFEESKDPELDCHDRFPFRR